ncbi:MAG: LysR family transcriptional regulator [Methylococcales bacterium]|nr:LysR family transcriptional regulator [Methylococcales bacterium]
MSRLNYHHLYYFWKVATQGNLTQVARQLHISQSALSTQIKQLETTIDVALFERQGRQLLLTEAGHKVLAFAQDIFSKGAELESWLKDGLAGEYQQVRIGMLSTMSRNFIERFISPIMGKENVRFSLYARNMNALLDGLVRHQFDLILTNTQLDQDDEMEAPWQIQLLARQPIAILAHPEHKPELPFPAGYQSRRWILPGSSNEIRRAFDGFCGRYDFRPEIQAEADDMAMLRLLVRDTDTFTVLPSVVVKDEIAQGTLAECMVLPNVYEHFYAITINRQFRPGVINTLLALSQRALA